jgi:hypothetical protein
MTDKAVLHARVQELLDRIRDANPGISNGKLAMLFLDEANEELTRFWLEQIADEVRRQKAS